MSTIIGPRRSIGWPSRVFYPAQVVDYPTPSDGSRWLSTSLPLAQAFRYWWAAKYWRLQYNIEFAGIFNFIFDSGKIPYGVGYDLNLSSPFLVPRQDGVGDAFAIKPLTQRYLGGSPILSPYEGSVGYGPYAHYVQNAAAANWFGDGAGTNITEISIMGDFGSQLANGTSFGRGGLVIDPSDATKVFMSFLLTFMNTSNNILSTSAYAFYAIFPAVMTLSATTLTFDGINIPFYENNPGVFTGSVELTTYDS